MQALRAPWLNQFGVAAAQRAGLSNIWTQELRHQGKARVPIAAKIIEIAGGRHAKTEFAKPAVARAMEHTLAVLMAILTGLADFLL